MERSIKKVISILVVVISIVVLAVFFTHWFDGGEPSYPSNDPRAAAVKTEKLYKNAYQDNLNDKDYESYQEGILGIINAFIAAKDYEGAEERLHKILDHVPESQRNVHTYMALSEVAKQKHDAKKYGEYTRVLIEKLNKDGRQAEAEKYKKQLKEAEQDEG